MVVGVEANRQHESWLSRSLKRGFYHFMQDTHRYEIKPNAGDFRLMSRKVVDALLALPERQRFMKGLYAWVGFKPCMFRLRRMSVRMARASLITPVCLSWP